MKKIILMIVIIVVVLTTMLSACGNKALFDTTYKFDYAIVEFPGGSVEKIKIKNWRDYEDGEQIQIVATDGTAYLVNSVNCVLVAED